MSSDFEVIETKHSAIAITNLGKPMTEIDLVDHLRCLMGNLEHDLKNPSDVLAINYWGDRIAAFTHALQEVRDIKKRK